MRSRASLTSFPAPRSSTSMRPQETWAIRDTRLSASPPAPCHPACPATARAIPPGNPGIRAGASASAAWRSVATHGPAGPGDRSAPRRCGRPRSMRTSRLRCSAGRCLSSPPGRAGRRRASSGRRSSAPCDAAGCRPPAASMPPGPPPGTWPGHRGVGLAQDSDVRKARSAITSVKRWPVMPSASAPRTFAARLSMNTAWAALMPRSSSTCW